MVSLVQTCHQWYALAMVGLKISKEKIMSFLALEISGNWKIFVLVRNKAGLRSCCYFWYLQIFIARVRRCVKFALQSRFV